MRLSTRVFLVLFVFALAPLLAVGGWMISSTEVARSNAKRMHEQLARLAAESVENAALEFNRSLSFVEDLERAGPGEAAELPALQRAAAAHPALVLLSVVGPDGKETVRMADSVLFSEAREDRSRDPLVQEALRTSRAALQGPLLRGGVPIEIVAHSLRDGRVALAAYSLKGLWDRLDRIRIGAHGRLLLLGADSRPLPGLGGSFPEPGWAGPGPLEDDSGWLDEVPTKAGVMIGAYVKAPSLDLRALTLQPRAEAYARPEKFFAKAVAVLLGMIMLVALAAVYLSSQLTRPLETLVAAAHRASSNDLDHNVPEVGWGELNDLSKAFNQMLGTLRDYRELQVDRLISEKAKVDGLVQNIPDGIVLIGLDATVLYINAVAERVLAATGPRKRAAEVLKDKALRDQILLLVQRRRRECTLETELVTPDGPRTFACRAAVIGADGRDTGVLLLLRDITRDKQLERMKEDFFHSIVHDLRNPLATIDGYASLMLKTAKLEAREKKYLDLMLRSTASLRALVKDILDLAKLESGTMSLELASVGADQILETIREVFTIQAQQQQIELRVVAGPGAAELVCDRKLVERVVMNLVGNALKFTPKDGRGVIEVSARGTEDRGIEFCVADNGPGIPAASAQLVFEKFKQLDDGVSKGGYGLGLSICRRVVDAHGGRIWVESDTGKGARFLFRLPRAQAGAPVAATGPRA